MLTLKQSRQLLGPRCKLSDSEVEELRDQFYSLAALAVDLHDRLGMEFQVLEGEKRELVEERAAIIEFEGNRPRQTAERAAMALTFAGNNEESSKTNG